jgi:hypothetical protein
LSVERAYGVFDASREGLLSIIKYTCAERLFEEVQDLLQALEKYKYSEERTKRGLAR